MRAFLCLTPALFGLSCASDLSSINREAVCDQAPEVWSEVRFTALQAAPPDEGTEEVGRWRDDARCWVYQLRRQGVELATDIDQKDVQQLKGLASELSATAVHVRDHFENLLDNNWLADVDDCVASGERPQRRNGTAMAKLCVRGEDHSQRMHQLLKTMEDHAQFAAADGSTTGVRAHSEHVLNCVQRTVPVDWDGNGNPQQMCTGDIGDFGLEGGGLGDYTSLVFEALVRHLESD